MHEMFGTIINGVVTLKDILKQLDMARATNGQRFKYDI